MTPRPEEHVDRPRWPTASEELLCPLGSPWFAGRGSGSQGVALGVVLVMLVVATRALVFPASIWDQDEAYLGLAVTHFDPANNQPHPPWFPLWIVLGKAVAPFAPEPARALQLMSSAAGSWIFFPLVALFSIWMRRSYAVAAAALYLFLPGPWFLSGRAYSEMPATLMLVVASAWWMRRAPGRRDLYWGSAAAGLCVLLRPQFAPVVVVLAAWRAMVSMKRDRVLVVAPLLGIVGIGMVGLVIASGRPSVLFDGFRTHASYHVSGLENAVFDVANLGISRALIRPELAALWAVLFVVGCVVWYRTRRAVGSPLPLVAGGIIPLLVTSFLFSDPGHARYALPVLALSCGPVVIGASTVLRRFTPAAVALVVACSLIVGLPQAQIYRSVESPVLRALSLADQKSVRDGGEVLVVDRTLVSFAKYWTATGRLRRPVVNDFEIEIGAVLPGEIEPVIAVFDAGRGGFVARGESDQKSSCRVPWVRRLGPDRFLDVTVVTQAQIEPVRTRW